MTDVAEWDVAAANNNSAAPDGFPEGMAPSGVNDAAREVMAAVARLYADINCSLISGGSGNVQTLTSNRVISAYADGDLFGFEAGFTNTGAVTMNVDGIGAKIMSKHDNSALGAGDLTVGGRYLISYDSTTTNFKLLGADTNINGMIADTAVGLTDTFPFYDGGNKKITYANLITDLEATLDHDSLVGFVADEHVAHGGVTLTAGAGLSGGGTIAANRSFAVDFSGEANIAIAATAATDSIAINDGGVLKQMDIQDMGVQVLGSSIAQTFALVDGNTLQLLTGATTRDWTIPPNSSVAFGIGTIIYVGSRDTAVLGIDPGAGVTLTSAKLTGTTTQDIKAGGMACIVKVATDNWMLSGDLV